MNASTALRIEKLFRRYDRFFLRGIDGGSESAGYNTSYAVFQENFPSEPLRISRGGVAPPGGLEPASIDARAIWRGFTASGGVKLVMASETTDLIAPAIVLSSVKMAICIRLFRIVKHQIIRKALIKTNPAIIGIQSIPNPHPTRPLNMIFEPMIDR